MIILSLVVLLVAIPLTPIFIPTTLVRYVVVSVAIISSSLQMNVINTYFDTLSLFSSSIHINLFSTILETLIYIASIATILANNFYNSSNVKPTYTQMATPREYGLIVLFTVLGASVLVSATDMLTIYLGIELQSFGLYTLAALYYLRPSATSAGLKYFLLGALASSMVLLGIGLLYSYTGITSFYDLYMLTVSADMLDTSDYNLSLIFGLPLGFILTGFLFKVSAAPFHTWAPDVYDDTPTIVTTFLIVIPKVAYIAVLAYLVKCIGPVLSISYNIFYLSFSAATSLIIGSLVGVTSVRIKRILTYSTISHVGFILLALLSTINYTGDLINGSYVNLSGSSIALTLYILQYTITNLAAFLVLLSIGYVSLGNKDITYINHIKGIAHSYPILSFSFTLLLLSIAGVPPIVGFFAKYSILYNLVHTGSYYLAVLAVLASVVSAVYYLGTITQMYFNYNPPFPQNGGSYGSLGYTPEGGVLRTAPTEDPTIISSAIAYIISILVLYCILFATFPNLTLNSIILQVLTT